MGTALGRGSVRRAIPRNGRVFSQGSTVTYRTNQAETAPRRGRRSLSRAPRRGCRVRAAAGRGGTRPGVVTTIGASPRGERIRAQGWRRSLRPFRTSVNLRWISGSVPRSREGIRGSASAGHQSNNTRRCAPQLERHPYRRDRTGGSPTRKVWCMRERTRKFRSRQIRGNWADWTSAVPTRNGIALVPSRHAEGS